MRIAVIGKGNVGGGLADLWERAGHELTRVGRGGGDVSGADFAALYDQIAGARERPGNLWCGDEEARDVVEQLNRDAGYEPVYAGGLENAAIQESSLRLFFAISQGGLGAFFYRMAPPDRF